MIKSRFLCEYMDDIRSKILEDAYQVLETQGESPIAREYLLKLLDVLSVALEKYSQGNPEESKNLALQLIDHRAMLMMLKQQTDELDALKKLSINLTSSPRTGRCAQCCGHRGDAPGVQRARCQHFSL
jgi:hypothetical protein